MTDKPKVVDLEAQPFELPANGDIDASAINALNEAKTDIVTGAWYGLLVIGGVYNEKGFLLAPEYRISQAAEDDLQAFIGALETVKQALLVELADRVAEYNDEVEEDDDDDA